MHFKDLILQEEFCFEFSENRLFVCYLGLMTFHMSETLSISIITALFIHRY